MELIIENQSFDSLGAVDTAVSVIWKRRFYTSGTFEIHTPATLSYRTLLQKGNFVTREDAVEAGIIDSIKLTQDLEKGEYITASGYMLSGLLARRYIAAPSTYTGQPVETIMRSLVDTNCIHTDPARAFPNFSLGVPKGYTETATAYTSGNLLEYLSRLSQVSNLGFRITKTGTQLTFDLYQGIDRSIEQMDVPQVIFSEEFDNLIGAEFETSDMNKVNAAIVTSSGYTYMTGGEASGFKRWESTAEIEPVTLTRTVDNNSEVIFLYGPTLAKMEAAAKAMVIPGTENFTGSVIPNGTVLYRQDYNLGDIVTVRSDRWEISTNVRITEIEEVYDEEGSRVIPTFGNPAPSVIDLMQR